MTPVVFACMSVNCAAGRGIEVKRDHNNIGLKRPAAACNKVLDPYP